MEYAIFDATGMRASGFTSSHDARRFRRTLGVGRVGRVCPSHADQEKQCCEVCTYGGKPRRVPARLRRLTEQRRMQARRKAERERARRLPGVLAKATRRYPSAAPDAHIPASLAAAGQTCPQCNATGSDPCRTGSGAKAKANHKARPV